MSQWRLELDALADAGLLRKPVTVEGPQGPSVRVNGADYLCFCSNNYLGLANHPALIDAAKAATEAYGTGTGASRLVSGSMAIHRELADAVARFKGAEAAIVFPTGYMANVGTISTLVGRGDTVYCDRLNHASIIDGCRLSGAELRVYPHKDADKLDALLTKHRSGRALVITDTVFSMDGDIAPLPDLVDVCERHGAMLMLDEAHATGVLGEHGRGALEHFGIRGAGRQECLPHQGDASSGVGQAFLPANLIVMGTFSKALGSLGGYVAGSRDLIDLLLNKARSFIYTTALPPAVCAASIAALKVVDAEPERRDALWGRIRQLHDGLRERGFDIGATETPITPVIIGESDAALALSKKLLDAGILAPAIRPPTVAQGSARLRLTPMATHSEEDVDKLLAALTQ
jgi:7-keto-8-aminopelargonate synthetase-like enzyme